VRIHRIYCKSVSGSDSVFDLDQSQSDHLIKVLRLKVDDEVEAFDGNGLSAICRIKEVNRKSIQLERISEMECKEPFKEKLTAIIPLIKKENLHFMVQKLSEIGVSDFVFYKPDLIDQSIAKKDHLKMLEKCEEVIINACKQCGSNFLPGFQMYLNINDAIDGLEDKTDVYVFDTQAIETFKANELLPERDVCIISGPESGFSESELETFKNKDLKMRIIGNNVLRAETAPIVISTLVLNQFDRI
jgi:16S rRNA (uracil1498-N3)-methyltransferase